MESAANCGVIVLVCSIERETIPGATRFAWVRDSHPDCHVVHVAEEVPQTPDESADFWPIWTDLIARHAGTVTTVFTSEDYGDELARHIGAASSAAIVAVQLFTSSKPSAVMGQED